MPRDPRGRAETMEWLIAGLNSVEPITMGWLLAKVFDRNPEQTEVAARRMRPRLAHLSAVLEPRAFLAAGRLTVADILMADILRTVEAQGGLDGLPVLGDYVARMTARPAFRKAHADQMAHWAAADAREAVA